MDPVEWARKEAERLGAGGAAPAAARQFLRDQSGPNSAFVELAEMYSIGGSKAAACTAAALKEWTEYVEAGLAKQVPEATRFRVEAATDLMEQVQQLLEGETVHPSAPMMLAGAALEEFLRGLVAHHPEATISGTRSITRYADTLRSAEAISRQDKKDLDSLAGDRNAAAHGRFDETSWDRARLMVDRVNLFMAHHKPEPEERHDEVGASG